MQFTTYDFYTKLLEETHLLIAGSTWTGKSVIINGMIYTALLDPTKQLILIDPKKVELSPFRFVPSVLKYADTDEGIIRALNYAVSIMLKRYNRMKWRRQKQSTEPHIYIFIDEYADLITTRKKEVQPLLFRLAQLGRAANIHLIIATQRPTRDIINGQIKVNIDSRLGLRCPTPQDSRNIIDIAGCESLPKYGECLLRRGADLERLKVPMISPLDIERLIKCRAG